MIPRMVTHHAAEAGARWPGPIDRLSPCRRVRSYAGGRGAGDPGRGLGGQGGGDDDHRSVDGQHLQDSAKENRRAVLLDECPDGRGGVFARLGSPGHQRAVAHGPGLEGDRLRVDLLDPSDLVPVGHDGRARVDGARGQVAVETACERGQRHGDDGDVRAGPGRRPGRHDDVDAAREAEERVFLAHVRLPDGAAGRGVRCEDERGACPPRGEPPDNGPPMRGQVEEDPRPRGGVEFFDEQVDGFVDPVVQDRSRKLHALAVVAVPGDAGAPGVSGDETLQVSDVSNGCWGLGHGVQPRVSSPVRRTA